MRTTITVDADLAPRLERARKKKGTSMARTLNDALGPIAALARRLEAVERQVRTLRQVAVRGPARQLPCKSGHNVRIFKVRKCDAFGPSTKSAIFSELIRW